MRRWSLSAMALVWAVSAMPASASVILFVTGSVTATRGSTGNTIEVDVLNTGPSSIVISGFSFDLRAAAGIDLTGAGFSTLAPYVFTGDSFDQINSAPLNTTAGASLAASDISDSGAGSTLGVGQTMGLGLVTFDVSPIAALGPLAVSFATDPAANSLSDQNGNSIAITSLTGGTIHVTDAVPEPATAAMLLAALMGLAVWRRFSGAGREASPTHTAVVPGESFSGVGSATFRAGGPARYCGYRASARP